MFSILLLAGLAVVRALEGREARCVFQGDGAGEVSGEIIIKEFPDGKETENGKEKTRNCFEYSVLEFMEKFLTWPPGYMDSIFTIRVTFLKIVRELGVIIIPRRQHMGLLDLMYNNIRENCS